MGWYEDGKAIKIAETDEAGGTFYVSVLQNKSYLANTSTLQGKICKVYKKFKIIFSWFKMQLWMHSMDDESFRLDFKTQVELTAVCIEKKKKIFYQLCMNRRSN